MGAFCSKLDKEEDHADHQHEKLPDGSPSKLHKKLLHHKMAAQRRSSASAPEAVSLVMGDYVRYGNTQLDATKAGEPLLYKVDGDYARDREEIARRGDSLAFDHRLTREAGQEERAAKAKLEIVRWNDTIAFYDDAPPLEGYGGQKHRRFPGDHFLANAGVIEQTGLFKVTQKMPKGAHLHIHFNSCLLPHVLLDIAETMDSMYICSNLPLVDEESLNVCEIQFLIRNVKDVKRERRELLEKEMAHRTNESSPTQEELKTKARHQRNLLHRAYKHPEGRQGEWMEYKAFLEKWKRESAKWKDDVRMKKFAEMGSKSWLISKLVFNEQEAHHPEQTVDG
jgi:adenosine deaminase CECR1